MFQTGALGRKSSFCPSATGHFTVFYSAPFSLNSGKIKIDGGVDVSAPYSVISPGEFHLFIWSWSVMCWAVLLCLNWSRSFNPSQLTQVSSCSSLKQWIRPITVSAQELLTITTTLLWLSTVARHLTVQFINRCLIQFVCLFVTFKWFGSSRKLGKYKCSFIYQGKNAVQTCLALCALPRPHFHPICLIWPNNLVNVTKQTEWYCLFSDTSSWKNKMSMRRETRKMSTSVPLSLEKVRSFHEIRAEFVSQNKLGGLWGTLGHVY